MSVSEAEKHLIIFEDLKSFLSKDDRHELSHKYLERSGEVLTAFLHNGYGDVCMFKQRGCQKDLDATETELQERGYDKVIFGPKHWIQAYKLKEKTTA